MNRLDEHAENGNGDAPTVIDFSNEKIFPIMCMASLEPLQLTEKYFFHLGLPNHNQGYSLNLSVFKKEELGPTHLAFVISTSTFNLFTSPEIFSMVFNDPESEEAKRFMLRPIEKFQPFKKAILLFEKRPYALGEFEKTIMDWKESLKEVL